MNFVLDIIAYPLGWIMWFFYSIIPNYGLVIILFTLITKILFLPIAFNQHKSIISKSRLQPQLKEIKDKYGKNPQKYNEEMMNLYKKEGISPASGCGSALLQMPILLGLIRVVYAPLQYILLIPKDILIKAEEITNKISTIKVVSKGMGYYSGDSQYRIVSSVKRNPEAFTSLGKDIVEKISNMNFNFLGLDLSAIPKLPHNFSEISWILLIPIFSGITSLLLSQQSMKNNSITAIDEQSKQMAQSMKVMMFITPIMSIWFSFKLSAAIGMYWIFSNVFIILQNQFLYKKYNPMDIINKTKIEMEERKEKERLERIEAKKNRDEDKGLTQKERNKIKLAEARKRDAEKYND